MRDVLLAFGLAAAIFLSFLAQEFIPPIALAAGARVLLVPVFFCYGACVLPFPAMLGLALFAGFLSDFTALQVVTNAPEMTDLDVIRTFTGSVELSAGWSILLFVASGMICQGLRPLVLRGQWWLPPLMTAGTTLAYLAFQFLGITLRRFETGGLYWSETVAWRIVAPSLLAAALALLVVLIAEFLPGAHERRKRREF